MARTRLNPLGTDPRADVRVSASETKGFVMDMARSISVMRGAEIRTQAAGTPDIDDLDAGFIRRAA